MAEFFDKDKKTVDEVLEKRMSVIYDFETKVISYYKNVEIFIQNALCKQEKIYLL